MARKHAPQPKLPPDLQLQSAKDALLGSASQPSQVEKFIQKHTWETVGLAALGGFLITALKPGRTMIRQTLMVGLSMGARKALTKYLAPK